MSRKLYEWDSFVHLLRERAERQGDQKACVFLAEGHIQQSTATFAELDRKARAIAAMLQELGCRGERTLLLYPTSIDYVQAFFACLYSNTIAVPAYPPRANRKLERLQFLIEDAQPKFILTTSSILSGLQKMVDKMPLLKNIHWINTDDFDLQRADDWKEEQIDTDAIAFLQYTSGSIAAPKGVMVSHGNLLYNQLVMKQAMEHDKHMIIASWLPLYHDMGLIGNLLAGIFNGVPCYLMSPADFIQNPINWLRAISTYRCTFSGGPNFAYDLCLRKAALPEYLSELDLSSWRIAFNGSEPVRAHTITRFQETFARCGFRPEAIYPCYGLAEATLFVSGRNRANAPVSMMSFDKNALAKQRAVIMANHNGNARQLVSCGSAWLEDTIRIVDPEAMTKCEDGQMGEVWFRSPAVAKGYWNNPKTTADVFNAHLAGNAEGPFLRTGDLGVVHNGEIYIGGRLKDVIIIGGSNHYPHDIEQTIEACHPSIRQGCTAAFAVEQDNEERLAIVAEVVRGQYTDSQMSELFETVRREIAREHEVDVYAGALVPPFTILKTSSGKIQRQATREAFVKDDLPVIYKWQRSDDVSAVRRTQSPTELLDTIKAWLLVELSSGLKIALAQLRPDAPIATYGVSSLIAADIASKISDRFSIPFPADKLFIGDPTINQIAFLVDRCCGENQNAQSHC